MNMSPSRSWLGILLLLDAAGLGWAVLVLFRVSTGSGRALLFGLSAQSLLLIGLTLLAAFGFLAVGLLTLRRKFLAERLIRALLHSPVWSIGLLAIFALIGWLLAWTPAEYFKSYYYYALRLLPLAGWLSFACGTLALFLLASLRGANLERVRAYLDQNRAIWLVSAITLVVIALIAWLASLRIVGMNPAEEDFWYGAGVPVLAWQVLTAILFGLGAAWAEKTFLHNGTKETVGRVPVDILVFVIVWAIAAAAWAQAPLLSNFMISRPYPPNFEVYPAADGQSYDIASQYALIGEGLFNSGEMRAYFERPLYAAFLFYLHVIGGQDFAHLLNLQAAIFAVFPALAYLIVRNIHSRAAGITLATLLTLRGVNGLASGGVLESSTQKMFLTDFPAAIGLALILLLAIRWAQQPYRHWHLAGWLGGCVGLGGFVRPHLLFLLPAGMALAIALYFRRKRIAAATTGFLLLAYLTVTLPWIQFNGSGMSLISMYLWRVEAMFNERFHWTRPQQQGTQQAWQVASLQTDSFSFETRAKPLMEFAFDHFLNNLALSPLALPTTLRNLGLRETVQKTETFWKAYWDGALSPSARVLVPVNLLFIALGIGLAWKRAHFIGLLPLFGMLVYFLINSLVRTSGGRYLVPADWVAILYYVLGLAALLEITTAWLGRTVSPVFIHPQADGRPHLLRGVIVLALLAGIGSTIPLTNLLYPKRYEDLDKFQIATKIEQTALVARGSDAAQMRAFLTQEQAVVMEGRALYPRYIGRGFNPLIPFHLLQPKPYGRMTFVLLGAQGHQPVVLILGDEWFPLPHTADAIILGCQADGFVNAWGVYLPESGALHLRLPETPLRCPLPEPVCDNNGGCRYE